ncbi:MAG: 2-C-methyl-D-erythritol 4-phosphate cytidylyltransferase [Pyrinomonadaceae bacterium]
MNVAIIVAAGRGTRAGSGGLKQFRALAGEPVVVHALRRFDECETISETVAVVPAEEAGSFEATARAHDLKKLSRVVAGGATRTESVWRGLESLDASRVFVVAVHDGVRPFVAPAEIDAAVRAAEAHGAALLVAHVTDTIKRVAVGAQNETPGETVSETLERASLRRALTPQCFQHALLRRAYERARAENLDATDDAALVERLGATVVAVAGDPRNIKLTRAEDFALAETILRALGDGG